MLGLYGLLVIFSLTMYELFGENVKIFNVWIDRHLHDAKEALVLNHRAFLKNVFAYLSGTVDLSIRLLSNAGGGGNLFTKAFPSWQHFVYCRAVFSSSLQCNAPQYWHIRLHGPHEWVKIMVSSKVSILHLLPGQFRIRSSISWLNTFSPIIWNKFDVEHIFVNN